MMRKSAVGQLGLAALLLTGIGAAAQSQQAGGTVGIGQQPAAPGAARRQRQNARVVHLSDLSVSAMNQGLKLTDDQKTKIQAILDKRAADYKALVLPPDQQGSSDAVQAANQKRLDIANKADSDIEAALTDDQKIALTNFKRDLQVMQQAGLPLDMVGDLNLTDDQRQKITAQARENQRTVRQKATEAQQSGTTMTSEARTAMLKENRDKILALLTPEQRATLDKYGKEHPAPGTGGARPGGNAAPAGTP